MRGGSCELLAGAEKAALPGGRRDGAGECAPSSFREGVNIFLVWGMLADLSRKVA